MKCLIKSQLQTQMHAGEMSLQSLMFLLLISAVQVTGLEGERCHTPGPPKDKMVSMFCDFMRTYNKSYKDQEEETRRFKIFVENLEQARQHQETEIGSAIYGVTKFSDLSAEEFQQGSQALSVPLDCEPFSGYLLPKWIPKSMDWRKKNCVTRVKDQMHCHSCWAFAVVGNVESHLCIKRKELITLSEQQLLDCGRATNNCNGGVAYTALLDVLHHGVHREDAYPPYTDKRENCIPANPPVYWIKKCVTLPNEREMKHFVARNGPVVIIVNILDRLRHYTGGIIRTVIQPNQPITNHFMLIIGYGKEGNDPYWIVKNSWGENWGEQGYVRIYRGENVGRIGCEAMSSIV